MTATPMAKPVPWTEDEVRQALVESIGNGFVDIDNDHELLRVVSDSDMARTRMLWDPDYFGGDGHRGTLWADLTPEETEELQRTMHDVLVAVERRANAELLRRATNAALEFGRRHPDIPRGHWPIKQVDEDPAR